LSQSRKQKILGDVKRARRRRTVATTIVVAIIMLSVIIAIIVLTPRNSSQTSLIGSPISNTLYSQLTGVNGSTLTAIGYGQGVTPFTSESGPLLTSGGKAEVLYIGAEYCPYCAAERWAVIVALSKFGSFSGLTYMLSADSPEVFPDTSTFSFRTATYNSQYISFVSVEEQDRNHSPLQSPTQAEQNLLNTYDPQGAIHFIDVANLNVTFNGGSQFSPGILGGFNWTQIGSQLNNPSTSIARSVDGAAGYLIGAICKADGSVPSNICGLTLRPPSMVPPDNTNQQQVNSLDGIIMRDVSLEGSLWRDLLALI
jgi:hypothetical protein